MILIAISTLAVAGCGVKSELRHPNPDYPRSYPVY